jgi:hypothetical protein
MRGLHGQLAHGTRGRFAQVRLRSFKLRLGESYVFVVPAVDLAGCAFGGPGVTLRAEPAQRAIDLAQPLLRALDGFEPGIRVRSMSVNLEQPRLLGTLHPSTSDGDARGRVIRVDGGPAFDIVMAEAQGLVAYLEVAAIASLERRAAMLM